jgi:hypothetical protein
MKEEIVYVSKLTDKTTNSKSIEQSIDSRDILLNMVYALNTKISRLREESKLMNIRVNSMNRLRLNDARKLLKCL